VLYALGGGLVPGEVGFLEVLLDRRGHVRFHDGIALGGFSQGDGFSQRDQLPLSVSAGIMFMLVVGFMLNFDARRYVYDKYTAYSLGTEYALFGGPGSMSGLSLRGGVNGGAAQSAAGAFSAGAGLKLLNADLDYALSPEGKLGSTQRITLKKKF